VEPRPAYDEFFEPVALALGHLVFGAAVLEDAMLADLVQRRVFRDGAQEVFGEGLVARLDRKPAGVLLDHLRQLGYEGELAAEIAAVIDERNHFVHHLFEDPEFLKALAERKSVDGLVKSIEAITAAIYVVIGKLAPGVTAGAEAMFGRSGPQLLALLREVDPSEIGSVEERKQLLALRTLPDSLFDEPSGHSPAG
jgi:hypothetical protein